MERFTIENLEKIEEVFQHAINLDGSLREAYLRAKCGDDQALLDMMKDLLRTYEEDPRFLESPLHLFDTETNPEASSPQSNVETDEGSNLASPSYSEDPLPALPETVGPYLIESCLGQGGLGKVYLAQQEGSVSRKVAIKCIRIDWLRTDLVQSRFDAEKQILASLNHPHVAHFSEADQTPDGRPYFVMEYIKGERVTKFCDEQRLTIEQRIELFIRICDGVHHAHTKGVIHRDLKPSNILVKWVDDVPFPKIIDFGISKIIAPDRSPHGPLTQRNECLGTREYMSPDHLDPSDMDTMADIYSLGLVLHELVLGCLPFDRKKIRQLSLYNFQKELTERQIERPSKALGSGIGGAVAKARRTSISSLVAKTQEDLDWILVKALESDRSRRYRSASEMADDLKRYLEKQPLLARPPTLIYRVKKAARRSPAGALSLGLVLIVMMLTVTGAVLFAKETAESSLSIQMKADLSRWRDLQAEEENDLWPANEEIVPKMELWLTEVSQIEERLSLHASRLDELDTLRRPHDAATEWEFKATRELLNGLVNWRWGKNPNESPVVRVQERLQMAKTVRHKSIGEYEEEWNRAIGSIRQNTLYNGLQIEPQVGLVPLGQDPNSKLWEFAYIPTGKIPSRDESQAIQLDRESALVFVLLPGGTFWMGSQKEDKDSRNYFYNSPVDENPVHSITLDPFFLSKYETTQAQWLRMERKNPSFYHGQYLLGTEERRPLHPVEQTSWEDCARVARRFELTLPTEAQWEYAARAGTETVWWTGSEKKSMYEAANFADVSYGESGIPWAPEIHEDGHNDGYSTHAPVGTYRANPFGFHDIPGNVWEWCRDWYGGRNSYTWEVRKGNGERIVQRASLRVSRGGCFGDLLYVLRSSMRQYAHPFAPGGNVGVRFSKPLRTSSQSNKNKTPKEYTRSTQKKKSG